MTQRSRFTWFLLGSAILFQSGCSCSRIPESPPGPGVLGEVRHMNSGAIVPTTPVAPSNPTNPGAPPPPNTYVNPTPQPTNVRPGYPQPAQPQPAPVAAQNSAISDVAPGPRLPASFPADTTPKKK